MEKMNVLGDGILTLPPKFAILDKIPASDLFLDQNWIQGLKLSQGVDIGTGKKIANSTALSKFVGFLSQTISK